ncbi:substrate-binding domain-containing protein [Mahella australiensis]|uniref:Monosaccharide ABC transporter substrate-binding protein, CUT2 family n=1 Tax=Mahella australiensis (strain DSM 15567 / CIP 107919 / 50-1 BON) TaxID=697281 RepID=F3ZVX0_MAHA5|nr:substrate-binding domain-containing protein [Mahella australiensis]AEE95344.1 monosaccharide ABC transporter substrate-binding protein, CUT2 family [Mahella australiensis 50-1 BON]
MFRNKGKRILALVMAVALMTGLMLTGCSNADNASPTNSSNSSGTASSSSDSSSQSPFVGSKDEEYYMVTFSSGIEYWKGCFKGFEDAGKQLGVKTTYTGANQYDVNQEVTVLEQVIAKNPAGIAVTCINPDALAAPIKKAKDAGIPIVTFDADSPSSGRYSFLATGNKAAGAMAADYLGKELNGKGKVAICTLPGQLNHEERVAGFKETMASKYPDIEIVSTVNGKADQTIAATMMSGVLQANPDVNGIFASDATSGVGVATAVKEAGKVGQVKIVSFDTDKGTLDLIKDGTITASVAQGTWNMGYWSMMFLYTLHHDLVNPVDGWKNKNINPLPPSVDTGTNMVTKDNVDAFYTK